jgi:hypothetical protein
MGGIVAAQCPFSGRIGDFRRPRQQVQSCDDMGKCMSDILHREKQRAPLD